MAEQYLCNVPNMEKIESKIASAIKEAEEKGIRLIYEYSEDSQAEIWELLRKLFAVIDELNKNILSIIEGQQQQQNPEIINHTQKITEDSKFLMTPMHASTAGYEELKSEEESSVNIRDFMLIDDGADPQGFEDSKLSMKPWNASSTAEFEELKSEEENSVHIGDFMLINDGDQPQASRSNNNIKKFMGIKEEAEGEEYPRISPYSPNKIIIGPNGTQITRQEFESISWKRNPTRKLLSFIFEENILATHTVSGKPSPAFYGRERPQKSCLNAGIVADIEYLVCSKCNLQRQSVRSAITTKCADTSRKFKRKMRDITADDQDNNDAFVPAKR